MSAWISRGSSIASGLALYDFGDLVRTAVSPVTEDEGVLSKVVLRLDIFRALTRGYLSEVADFLTETERDNLVAGGRLMTFEVRLRFLTDYLEGDVTFETKYADHNLVRCRTQMILVKALEEQQEELESIVEEEYERKVNQ